MPELDFIENLLYIMFDGSISYSDMPVITSVSCLKKSILSMNEISVLPPFFAIIAISFKVFNVI